LNSRRIAILIVFASITIILNLSPLKIPAPYAPFLIYQIWEIPIVTVTLLYGFSLGFLVSIINTLILIAVFPGALPTGPIYNFMAVLSMLCGIYLISKIINGFTETKSFKIFVVASSVLGAVLRVIVMTAVNWLALPLPPPIGFSIPSEVAVTLLPFIGFFNATLVLYTVPLGELLAKIIKNNLSTV